MRQVEHDQALGHLRQIHRELPGYHATPVVPGDRRLVASEVADNRGDVRHEQAHIVALHALRLVAQVATTLVDRHDLKRVRERRHLVSPGIPEVWKAMNHHDQRSSAERRIVNLHAALRYGVSMRHPVEDILLLAVSGWQEQQAGRQRRRSNPR